MPLAKLVPSQHPAHKVRLLFGASILVPHFCSASVRLVPVHERCGNFAVHLRDKGGRALSGVQLLYSWSGAGVVIIKSFGELDAHALVVFMWAWWCILAFYRLQVRVMNGHVVLPACSHGDW